MSHPEQGHDSFTVDMQNKPQLDNKAISTLVEDGVTYVEEAMPRFMQDLQKLCMIDSPSEDSAGLNKMAEQLGLLLRSVGMRASIITHPRGNAVVGTMGGSDPTAPACLLIGHHDTVHPVGSASAHTRLEVEKLYAPGTVDMKAGLLQGIYALELLRKHNYQAFSKITFLSVPDEEIFARYHVGLIRELAQGKPFVIGLEGARSIGNVVTRRKGCTHYRLSAKGQAAHAGSNPERGRNAVVELAHQIVQAQSFMGWREGLTINAGPIKGGSRANIVSDYAEIVFDLRFLQPEDRRAAEARWRELLQQQLVPGVELTLTPVPDSMQPMVATERSLALAGQVQLIAEQILHVPFDPETRGGASDCCNTAIVGCPSIDGLGAIGGGAHTDEEYVLLAPISQRIALLAGLIASIPALQN
ncbi:M20/M25/M40 family metallo-hydrolase [Dictyobacter kobayashii]|uniref:Peptidase M20 n=1 Tax=Dictyobacter kobayashii TaxID=2014872 RepID=A0A402AHD5_9CHLR|nr:M20/M25/M40 family metallo-hydrolase [Dictyobacter kobayashii]GCE18542.1 peptidase M20 [Dictyobacter kobayashii]